MARGKSKGTTKTSLAGVQATKIRSVLTIAQEQGLLSGARTRLIRGRLPAGLVAEAKQRTGITSDTKLIEAALANIAVEDNYWAWMRQHHGTVSKDLDLEF